jgi:hypothetical protein
MSSSVAPARGRPRRSTSSSRDQYYPGAAKRHPDEHDELSDSGSDGGYSDEGHRPHSPVEARPRRTRTLMTPQQLTILNALLQQVRGLSAPPAYMHTFLTPSVSNLRFPDSIPNHKPTGRGRTTDRFNAP